VSAISLRRTLWRACAVLSISLCLLAVATRKATAQAVPAATWPIGDTSPADQPLPGQMLGSDLTLNQGVNAINAENESFDRFGLGLSAQGGLETNFLGTQTNQITTGIMQFGAEAGLQLHNERTRFFALYQPQYNVYPAYPEINNFAQRYFQSLTHDFTARSSIAWGVTGARFLSLNQYAPQTLGIGGLGIIVPTLGTELRQDSFESTNAATSIRYQYLLSTRTTLTGTLTGGFFLLIPADISSPNRGITERFFTSGADLRLDYQWSPSTTVGAEITPIYIYGLQPHGHEVAETVQATYHRQITATLSARVGAGPLFIQYSSPLFGSLQETSYAITGVVTRQLRQSQFSVGYNRAFLVNLLSPAVVSNSVNGNAYLPFHGHWIYTGTATYARDAGSSNTFGTGQFVGASTQLAYQVARRFQVFALYSVISERFSSGTGSSSQGFTRNQIGGGIRFNLGNPMTSGGMQ
jgi:hypothetical protein